MCIKKYFLLLFFLATIDCLYGQQPRWKTEWETSENIQQLTRFLTAARNANDKDTAQKIRQRIDVLKQQAEEDAKRQAEEASLGTVLKGTAAGQEVDELNKKIDAINAALKTETDPEKKQALDDEKLVLQQKIAEIKQAITEKVQQALRLNIELTKRTLKISVAQRNAVVKQVEILLNKPEISDELITKVSQEIKAWNKAQTSKIALKENAQDLVFCIGLGIANKLSQESLVRVIQTLINAAQSEKADVVWKNLSRDQIGEAVWSSLLEGVAVGAGAPPPPPGGPGGPPPPPGSGVAIVKPFIQQFKDDLANQTISIALNGTTLSSDAIIGSVVKKIQEMFDAKMLEISNQISPIKDILNDTKTTMQEARDAVKTVSSALSNRDALNKIFDVDGAKEFGMIVVRALYNSGKKMNDGDLQKTLLSLKRDGSFRFQFDLSSLQSLLPSIHDALYKEKIDNLFKSIESAISAAVQDAATPEEFLQKSVDAAYLTAKSMEWKVKNIENEQDRDAVVSEQAKRLWSVILTKTSNAFPSVKYETLLNGFGLLKKKTWGILKGADSALPFNISDKIADGIIKQSLSTFFKQKFKVDMDDIRKLALEEQPAAIITFWQNKASEVGIPEGSIRIFIIDELKSFARVKTNQTERIRLAREALKEAYKPDYDDKAGSVKLKIAIPDASAEGDVVAELGKGKKLRKAPISSETSVAEAEPSPTTTAEPSTTKTPTAGKTHPARSSTHKPSAIDASASEQEMMDKFIKTPSAQKTVRAFKALLGTQLKRFARYDNYKYKDTEQLTALHIALMLKVADEVVVTILQANPKSTKKVDSTNSLPIRMFFEKYENASSNTILFNSLVSNLDSSIINQQDAAGNSVLHFVVQLILKEFELYKNPNYPGNRHRAWTEADERWDLVVTTLVEHGCDTSLKNNDGKTPLEILNDVLTTPEEQEYSADVREALS